ncbi:MAG: YhfC family glutamic-type intramembrane protease [Actinomycetes bacterium]
MTAQLTLAGMGVAILALVVGVAVWLRRRYRVRWTTWLWGALAFVLSQLLRLPLLAGAGPAASALGVSVTAAVAGVALVTSGLCEEGSRWIVLRFGARRERERADGLMFGAGHGGIEALIVFGVSIVGGLVLLASGDAMLEQARQTTPDQVDALTAQLEAVRTLTPGTALVGIWERVPAMVFHIAASLAVLRAVRERRLGWLWFAMAAHIGFNAAAVGTLQLSQNVLLTEAVVTALGALFLWGILRGWGAPRHFADRPDAAAHAPAAGTDGADGADGAAR